MTSTAYDVNELIRLWGEGLSVSAIGTALGVSKNTVTGRIHRLRKAGVDIVRRHAVKPYDILQLTPTACRYIVSEDPHRGALYCGDPQHYRSYCAAHARLCYTPVKRGH
jgi:GcrA cell cycle regulator